MGFFDALKRVISGDPSPIGDRPLGRTSADGDGALYEAVFDLTDGGSGADDTTDAPPQEAGAYDRAQWQRRLARVLAELPASEAEWVDLIADGKALGFDPDWIDRQAIEEFTLMVRRAVADQVVTEDEHRKLDLARYLIGMTEDEAEALLNTVVAEANQFFDKPVEGA